MNHIDFLLELAEKSNYKDYKEYYLILEFENGMIVEGYIDTIYETDNDHELDSNSYEEFYAIAFKIEKSRNYFNLDGGSPNFTEINPYSKINVIRDKKSGVLWKKG